MASSSSIVGARPGHLDDVHRLNRAAVPAVNDVPESFFREFLTGSPARPGRYFRVVQEADAPPSVLAFLLALPPEEDYSSPNYRWFSQRYRRFLYVDRVVVAREGRRRGLGSLLYGDLAAFARSTGAPRICCEVNLHPRNESSLRFHERLGFRPVGSQETEPLEATGGGDGDAGDAETGPSVKVVSLLVLDLP